MTRSLIAATLLLASASFATAQTNPAPNAPAVAPGAPAAAPNRAAPAQGTTSPVPNSPVDANAPLPGANSFTEAQAISRIQDAGFSNVTGLAKAENGIWRGRAMRNGQQVGVALDYRGNVVQQ